MEEEEEEDINVLGFIDGMFNNGTTVSVTVGFYIETHTKLKTRHIKDGKFEYTAQKSNKRLQPLRENMKRNSVWFLFSPPKVQCSS